MPVSPAFARCAFALAVLLALPAAQAQNLTRESKLAEHIKAMGLENVQDISYFDEKKVAISRQEFEKRLADGMFFTADKHAEAGKEVKVSLTLVSKEAMQAIRTPIFKVKAGDPFPAFSLRQLDGTVVNNEALLGRYTLINFMFADCAPCVKEVPYLNAFSKNHPGMNFVAMTFDPDAEAKKFVETTSFEWKMLAGARQTIDAAGVRTYPTFALLDPRGAVVAIAPHTAFAGAEKGLARWVQGLMPSAAAGPIPNRVAVMAP
jgi:thiol-disulfide isomerase/thioredoxin